SRRRGGEASPSPSTTGGGEAPTASAPAVAQPSGTAAPDKPRALPGVALESGTVSLRDGNSGLSVEIKDVAGVLLPSDHLLFRIKGVGGGLAMAGSEHGPRFGAREVQVQATLRGMRPDSYPSILVQDGFATPLPSLSLTGISGRVGPPPAGVKPANAAD